MSLLSMIEGLHEAGVRFVVIGGVAGVAHGSARVTNALELCYDPAPDNRAALAAQLGSWDAYPRAVDPRSPFVMDAVTLARSPVLTLTTAEGDLDLFDAVPGVGAYPAALRHSVEIALPPVSFRALTLAALIQAKRAVARPKDIEALAELEALRALRAPR